MSQTQNRLRPSQGGKMLPPVKPTVPFELPRFKKGDVVRIVQKAGKPAWQSTAVVDSGLCVLDEVEVYYLAMRNGSMTYFCYQPADRLRPIPPAPPVKCSVMVGKRATISIGGVKIETERPFSTPPALMCFESLQSLVKALEAGGYDAKPAKPCLPEIRTAIDDPMHHLG